MPGSPESTDEEIHLPACTPPPDPAPAAPLAGARALPDRDRWRWRAKVRANPYQLRVYRLGVGLVGVLLIALGVATGWLPGPGGIPLVLLGLAVLASEFVWARRVMLLFKAQLVRFQSWSRWQQTGFWVVFFSVCGVCGYLYLLALGIPAWMPAPADDVLQRLPGL